MRQEYLIGVEEFCTYYNIEISFINSLNQDGLVEITTINEKRFIDAGQLQYLEKFIRLYYELDINLEGIESIAHLLRRIDIMQNEIIVLRNKLRLYEANE